MPRPRSVGRQHRRAAVGPFLGMRPRELVRSGMTCWRRLRDWQEAGIWAGLQGVRLEQRATWDNGTGAEPAWTARPGRRKRGA